MEEVNLWQSQNHLTVSSAVSQARSTPELLADGGVFHIKKIFAVFLLLTIKEPWLIKGLKGKFKKIFILLIFGN